MAASVLEVLARAAVVVAGPAPQCAATAWQVVMGHLALGTDAAAGCRVGCVRAKMSRNDQFLQRKISREECHSRKSWFLAVTSINKCP